MTTVIIVSAVVVFAMGVYFSLVAEGATTKPYKCPQCGFLTDALGFKCMKCGSEVGHEKYGKKMRWFLLLGIGLLVSYLVLTILYPAENMFIVSKGYLLGDINKYLVWICPGVFFINLAWVALYAFAGKKKEKK